MPSHYPSLLADRLLRILAILLILLVALLQALGFFKGVETSLEHQLHRHFSSYFLREASPVVLISFNKSPQGYSSIEVAMVLRGLEALSPRCIVVNGPIEHEQGPVPFLPTIIAKLKQAEIALIAPQIPSPSARFQSVPLIRYSLTSSAPKWPSVDGKGVPGAGNAFLPQNTEPQGSAVTLPLLAKASDGVPVGSLWWWALPKAIHQRPPLLLFGTILLLPNHTAIHLTSTGGAKFASSSILEMPLDDFLLQCEQKEQGTISPSFDSIWNKSTVLIGTHDDLATAASLAALLEETAWHHLSLGVQLMILVGWISSLVLAPKFSIPGPILAGIILLLLAISTLLLLHHGIIFPFMPGAFVVVVLLGKRR